MFLMRYTAASYMYPPEPYPSSHPVSPVSRPIIHFSKISQHVSASQSTETHPHAAVCRQVVNPRRVVCSTRPRSVLGRSTMLMMRSPSRVCVCVCVHLCQNSRIHCRCGLCEASSTTNDPEMIAGSFPVTVNQPEKMPAPRLWYAVVSPFSFHANPVAMKAGKNPAANL